MAVVHQQFIVKVIFYFKSLTPIITRHLAPPPILLQNINSSRLIVNIDHNSCKYFTNFLGVTNEFNNTPLHYASWGGHIEVVRYLVEDCKCKTGE